MAITIRRQGDDYFANVTPTGKLTLQWSNTDPLDRTDVIDRLVEIGYHLQDIADALQLADQDWEDQRRL